MSVAGAQASSFYKDVATNRKLWTVTENNRFIAPRNPEGKRTIPFWSSLARVQKIIKNVPAYSNCEPYEMSWEDFVLRWIPQLTDDGVLVGINWSGGNALGYDLEPDLLRQAVEAAMGQCCRK
jgi:Protein of unknown function (DUF2750)